MIYKIFEKKSRGTTTHPEQQLANELYRSITRKFKKRKVYPSFQDNIWGADFADM